jgi:AAA+ superfamily predicted ATPase
MSGEIFEISKLAKFTPNKQINERFFAGYERQMRACKALCIDAASGQCHKVLLFGFPGVGKSEFPNALAYRLNHEHNQTFSLLYIKCHRFASIVANEQEIRKHLKEFTDSITRYSPLILAFDEFDEISRSRKKVGSSTHLSSWTLNFLTNGVETSKKGMVIFGIVNYPDEIEVAIRDRFQYTIYFDLPDQQTIEGILSLENIPRSKEIAERLLDIMARDRRVLTGRGLIYACRSLKRLNGMGELDTLRNMNVEEVCEKILIHATPIDYQDITDYKSRYNTLIEHSEKVVKYWEERFNHMEKR